MVDKNQPNDMKYCLNYFLVSTLCSETIAPCAIKLDCFEI